MANKVSEKLKEELEQEKPSYFWGMTIAITSVMNGFHLLFYPSVLSDRLETYLLGVNEDLFGLALVMFGVVKIIGIIIDNVNMRGIGIVGLSIVWGMLWVVAMMFSFGIGYPSTAYLTNGLMLVACLRVSYRGVRK